MYGKLFASMYEGTLCGNWKALVTFQQMIILCDKEGFLDMTPQAIAARTGIPLDVITDGIQALEQPDPHSRTPDLEGRRIERLDERRPWGWRVVNYLKYRVLVAQEEKRQADRERIAAKRAAERDNSQGVASCREVSQAVANVAQAEAEAEKNQDPAPRASIPEREHPEDPEQYLLSVAGPKYLGGKAHGLINKLVATHGRRLVVDKLSELMTRPQQPGDPKAYFLGVMNKLERRFQP